MSDEKTDDKGVDTKGDGRPAFLRDLPRDPALDIVVAAFEAGDFARVRSEGAKLLASSKDDAVKKATEGLIARTKPDPMAAVLLAIAGVLLLALTAWWMTHDGPK